MTALWQVWLAPVNLVLLLALVAIGLVIWRAQRREDFDWADALRDDAKDNKISVWRVIVFGAFAAHTWVLMHEAAEAQVSDGMYLIYGAFWSMSSLGAKIIDKLTFTVGPKL